MTQENLNKEKNELLRTISEIREEYNKKQKASEEIQNNLTEEINRLCKKVTQITKEKV